MWKRVQRCVFYIATTPFFAISRRDDPKLLSAAIKAHCGNLYLRCAPELADDSAELFNRIIEAINLIQEVDERRFDWIWNGMQKFYVSRDLPTQFWSRHGTCVLNASKIATGKRADIALSIVHEAAHARLCRSGIYAWPDIRQRIEGVCVREEMRFLRRLGNAGWRVEARLDWYTELLKRLDDRRPGVSPAG